MTAVGRGVWRAWEDSTLFEGMRITSYRAIGWGEDENSDMCADWEYQHVEGVSDSIPA